MVGRGCGSGACRIWQGLVEGLTQGAVVCKSGTPQSIVAHPACLTYADVAAHGSHLVPLGIKCHMGDLSVVAAARKLLSMEVCRSGKSRQFIPHFTSL